MGHFWYSIKYVSFFRFFNQQRLIAFSSSTNIRRGNTLKDEIGDDDFREVSGDKTDPDWFMIKRTLEAYIHGIPVGNTSIIWTCTCHVEQWPSPASSNSVSPVLILRISSRLIGIACVCCCLTPDLESEQHCHLNILF